MSVIRHVPNRNNGDTFHIAMVCARVDSEIDYGTYDHRIWQHFSVAPGSPGVKDYRGTVPPWKVKACENVREISRAVQKIREAYAEVIA